MQGRFDKSIFRGKPKKDPKKWFFFAVLTGYFIGVLFYLMEDTQSAGLRDSSIGIEKSKLISELLVETLNDKVDKTAETFFFSTKNDEQENNGADALIKEMSRVFGGIAKQKTILWQWKSEKAHRSGSFTYTEKKSINTNDVCSNYKIGSLLYRDCRKAAKKYFKNACASHYKAACAAADMIL